MKKVHTVIKFNQKASLKPYIDMNTKLRHGRRKLFSVGTKLSSYKIFHRKFIGNINEKNSNINE